MDILFWRKNKLIDSYSISLADGFFSSVPADKLENFFAKEGQNTKQKTIDKKTVRKFDSLIESTVTQMKKFINEQSLGIYGKARLHMQFTERLKELGYNEELAKTINESIMLKIPMA